MPSALRRIAVLPQYGPKGDDHRRLIGVLLAAAAALGIGRLLAALAAFARRRALGRFRLGRILRRSGLLRLQARQIGIAQRTDIGTIRDLIMAMGTKHGQPSSD